MVQNKSENTMKKLKEVKNPYKLLLEMGEKIVKEAPEDETPEDTAATEEAPTEPEATDTEKLPPAEGGEEEPTEEAPVVDETPEEPTQDTEKETPEDDKKDGETDKKTGEKIPGGRSSTQLPTHLDKYELAIGIEVEMEHTEDRATAVEIALDHLVEDPKYYTKLVDADLVDEPKALDLFKQMKKDSGDTTPNSQDKIREALIRKAVKLMVLKEIKRMGK